MNISKEEFKSYLSGRLSADKKVKIDRYLEEHALERKALEGAIEYEESGSFKELIDEIDDLIEVSSEHKVIQLTDTASSDTSIPRITKISRWLLASAAVALMFIFIQIQGATNSLDLRSYFDTYPDVITNIVRGEASQLDETTIGEAMKYYNAHEFGKALPIFIKLTNQNPDNKNIVFYTAIVEFALGDYVSSLPRFDSLSVPQSRFQYDDGALWYKALCLMHLDREDEAKAVLTKISSQSHYKKKEALDLLESL